MVEGRIVRPGKYPQLPAIEKALRRKSSQAANRAIKGLVDAACISFVAFLVGAPLTAEQYQLPYALVTIAVFMATLLAAVCLIHTTDAAYDRFESDGFVVTVTDNAVWAFYLETRLAIVQMPDHEACGVWELRLFDAVKKMQAIAAKLATTRVDASTTDELLAERETLQAQFRALPRSDQQS